LKGGTLEKLANYDKITPSAGGNREVVTTSLSRGTFLSNQLSLSKLRKISYLII